MVKSRSQSWALRAWASTFRSYRTRVPECLIVCRGIFASKSARTACSRQSLLADLYYWVTLSRASWPGPRRSKLEFNFSITVETTPSQLKPHVLQLHLQVLRRQCIAKRYFFQMKMPRAWIDTCVCVRAMSFWSYGCKKPFSFHRLHTTKCLHGL